MEFISHLRQVRQTGKSRWIACCPAHLDETPSLSIRVLDDGRVLLHCFAGCDTADVLGAIGLTFADLFPDGALQAHIRRTTRPFNAIDVLRCVAFEAHIAANAASSMGQGKQLNVADRERLLLAASRLQRAAEVADA